MGIVMEPIDFDPDLCPFCRWCTTMMVSVVQDLLAHYYAVCGAGSIINIKEFMRMFFLVASWRTFCCNGNL